MLLNIYNNDSNKIEYGNNQVVVNSKVVARYGDAYVRGFIDKKYLGELFTENNITNGETLFGNPKRFYVDTVNHTINDFNTKIAVATYNTDPNGALLSYIAFLYLKSINSTILNTPLVKDNNDNLKKMSNEIKKNNFIPKPTYNMDSEKKGISQMPKYNYTKPPKNSVKPSISSGSGKFNISPIAIILGIILFIVTIACIPQSWKDMDKFLEEKDPEIIVCFSTSIIGGFISVIYSLVSKRPYLRLSAFIYVCVCLCGIVFSSIITLESYFNGEFEFTGAFIFDVVLCVFAPIVGCLQFCIPIGIISLILCGIICFLKKRKG